MSTHRIDIVRVGKVGKHPFDLQAFEKLVLGASRCGPNILEGVVGKPVVEALTPKGDRMAFKLVSPRYLDRH